MGETWYEILREFIRKCYFLRAMESCCCRNRSVSILANLYFLYIGSRLEGKQQWKDNPESPYYDFELIGNRINQLRRARETGDIASVLFLLRTSLNRNIGECGDPLLYGKTRVGTKKLIEDYIDEVIRNLNLICDTSDLGNSLTLNQKLDFFVNTRQSFGRTALLLSGGATLGLTHIGVIKALYETNLLPRIISGSSVGSLIAALVCSKTENELFTFFGNEEFDLNALESPDEQGNLFYKLNRFLNHGVIYDIEVLKACIRNNVGDVTFQEAYNRTRRVLNITVSSSTKYEMPRLLNYLTAPNVLIWSAVAASCAIPFVYKAAPLMARDKMGNIVPWNPSGHRWIDGSVENDLPMLRLSEMFNVNHFIVCQVNPHVVPFLSDNPKPNRWKNILSKAVLLAKSELQHRLSQLIEMNVFPTTFHHVNNVLSQRYYGDITIIPKLRLGDFAQLISNPSRENLWDAVVSGEKATWSKVSIIKNHCQIELELDKCIYKLRCQKLDLRKKPTIGYSYDLPFPKNATIGGKPSRRKHPRITDTAKAMIELPMSANDTETANEQSILLNIVDGSNSRKTKYGPYGNPSGSLWISSTGSVGYRLNNGEKIGAIERKNSGHMDGITTWDALLGQPNLFSDMENTRNPPKRVKSAVRFQDLVPKFMENDDLTGIKNHQEQEENHFEAEKSQKIQKESLEYKSRSVPGSPLKKQSLSSSHSPHSAISKSLQMTDIINSSLSNE